MKPAADEVWCYEVLRRVRWPEGMTCPFCKANRVTPHSRFESTPRRRYLCLGCRRTFTDLTGTPLARSHVAMTTWFRCLRRIEEVGSTAELARDLGVKWDTAAHLQRRLSSALRHPGLVRRLRKVVQELDHD